MRLTFDRRRTLFTVAVLVVGASAPVITPTNAAAQEVPVDPIGPISPTGRSVCQLAFTVAGAVSFTSGFVPPEVPVGPNDVVIALDPVLRACAGVFPPSIPRQCFVSELYPNTGLPITLLDPIGVATEQAEALARAVPLLGPGLGGPLQMLFAVLFGCVDQQAGGGTEGDDDVPVSAPASPTSGLAPRPPAVSDASNDASLRDPVLDFVVPPNLDLPLTPGRGPALASAVPEPLEGTTFAIAAALIALGAFLFWRVLAPHRRRTLLDATSSDAR